MKNITKYLKINDEETKLYHENGKLAIHYREDRDGTKSEHTYDKHGNVLTYKNSYGFSLEYTRDKHGNVLTYEDSDGGRITKGFDILASVAIDKHYVENNFYGDETLDTNKFYFYIDKKMCTSKQFKTLYKNLMDEAIEAGFNKIVVCDSVEKALFKNAEKPKFETISDQVAHLNSVTEVLKNKFSA